LGSIEIPEGVVVGIKYQQASGRTGNDQALCRCHSWHQQTFIIGRQVQDSTWIWKIGSYAHIVLRGCSKVGDQHGKTDEQNFLHDLCIEHVKIIKGITVPNPE
jgi:hypothetical protein